MKDIFLNKFQGVGTLLGDGSLDIIKESKVLVIGLGGVGTWTVESLARSGFMNLTLMDLDDICVSNTNRQLHAHEGNYGKFKAEALAERVNLINPDCFVDARLEYYSSKNSDKIIDEGFDLIIDAIDTVDAKCILIRDCYRKGVSLVTVGGAGGKQDPTKVTYANLNKSYNDMLLKGVRKKLKREFNIDINNRKFKIPAVFSIEPSAKSQECNINPGVKFDCEGGLGTATYMTGTFGFVASYIAVKELLKKKGHIK